MPHDPRPTSIVLASGSPRRRELLGRLGVPFVVDPGDIIEPEPRSGEDPAAYALALARQKASHGVQRHPDVIVLGADTVVTIDGIILGKPRDGDHALEMLQRLRGRCHHVITAVAICRGATERSDTVVSEVWMHWVSDRDLRAYTASGEPMDKAGSYALQGLGGRLVESIAGCYNNIVGLPLCLSARLLAGCDVLVEVPEEIDLHSPFGRP
jgi:septum formation protein